MTEDIKQLPIFCINLERATERRQFIQEFWVDNLKIDLTFWNACDRRDIENGKSKYLYSKEASISNIGRELSYGEIACASSFISLYEHIISNDIQEAIIMEDDICPTISSYKVLHDIIEAGRKEFPDSEMMLLHQLDPENVKSISLDEIYYIKKDKFSKCLFAPWGNQLFYITNKGAQVLLDALNPITTAADRPQHILCEQGKLAISNIPLCTHDWGKTGTTYIGNAKRRTNRIYIP